jgi:predicted phage tail component-like protein
MTTDVTLNAVALSTAVPAAVILEVRRPLVARRRHKIVEVPGRAGAWTFDEQPGMRLLELDVDVQADTMAARRTAVRDLAYWCDIGTAARLIIDDEPDRFYDALLDDEPDVLERLVHAATTLKFLVGPYAQAIAVSSEAISITGSPGSGTFAIPDKVTAEPVVELTAVDGTVTSFVLEVNGYELSWGPGADALALGESLTISSISDTVTLGLNDDVNLTGAFDAADLTMADVAGEFPLLLEGTTEWSLAWTGTATRVDLEFTWRERFR